MPSREGLSRGGRRLFTKLSKADNDGNRVGRRECCSFRTGRALFDDGLVEDSASGCEDWQKCATTTDDTF